MAGLPRAQREQSKETLAQMRQMPEVHAIHEEKSVPAKKFAKAPGMEPMSMDAAPREDDRIMVLKEKWTRHILSGRKTLEIRNRKYRPGLYFIGTSEEIRGVIKLGDATEIRNMKQWRDLVSQHLWEGQDKLPYSRTYALRIKTFRTMGTPVKYMWKQGAIGIIKYRPIEETLPPTCGPVASIIKSWTTMSNETNAEEQATKKHTYETQGELSHVFHNF